MAVTHGSTRFESFYTVQYEELVNGQMRRRVTDYCEDPIAFRKQIEKRGGKVLRVDGPRQVETIPVYF